MMHIIRNRGRSCSDCLAIIGNGFDMAHDLKTGYNHFINAQDSNAFSEYKAFLQKYCCNVKEWGLFEERINELTYNCFCNCFDDTENDVDLLQDIKRINTFFENLNWNLLKYLAEVITKGKVKMKVSVKWALRRNVPAISFNYTDTAELYTKKCSMYMGR